MSVTISAVPVLVIPFIIVVGVVSGIFTITECAAVAVAYALILAVLRRGLQLRSLSNVFLSTSVETTAVTVVIAASAALAWPLTRLLVSLLRDAFT